MLRIVLCAAFVLLGMLILFSGCGGPQAIGWETFEKHDFTIARADNGYVLPASHLYEMIYFSRLASTGGLVSDSAIGEFRDSILVDTLIGFAADDVDLRSHYYFWREYRDQYHQLLRKLFWDSTVVNQVTIDSAEIVDYYERHKDKFNVPEQALVYHLLASPIGFAQNADSVLVRGMNRQQLWEAAREYAWQMHRLLDYGEAIENVAYRYSHDQMTREAGGRLGWTIRNVYVAPFDSVAFSLEPGTYSEPYSDPDGFHILYVQARTEAGPMPLDSPRVLGQVAQGVFDEKSGEMAAAILDSLVKAADLVFNDAVLDTNVYYVADTTWAAIVNGSDTIVAMDLKGLEEDYRKGYKVDSTDREMRIQMINQTAGPVLVLQAARSLGIDTLRQVVLEEERIRRGACLKVLLSDLYTVDYTPPDSAIEAYYWAHIEDYQPTRHLEVEQLATTDRALAQFLREQAGSGMTMAEMAKYYAAEGYKISYEYLGILDKAIADTAIYAAAEATAAGKMSRPVEKDGSFYVLKILSRKYSQPLEMARNEIKSKLIAAHRQEHWRAKRDEYFARYHVELLRNLPAFELPRLSDRNHPRTLPRSR